MQIKNLVITLVLALIAGAISYSVISLYSLAEQWRVVFPQLILALPLAFAFAVLLKAKTLYYPYKIYDLNEMDIRNIDANHKVHWNRWMSLYHYVGALISHLVGASVGREGVVVLTTTGIVRLFNFNLQYWGPIAAAIGFAAITGSKWVGLVFLIEMFTTQLSQKFWTFIGSWTAILFLQTLQVPHLLPSITISNIYMSHTFFEKISFVIILALIIGYLARVYKAVYFNLSDKLKHNNIWQWLLVLILTYVLSRQNFSALQGLSLNLLDYYSSGTFLQNYDVSNVFLKVTLTLLCVAVGFYGGEYVPLVVASTGLSVFVAQYMGFTHISGLAFGGFALFAGVTRLKWTAIVLSLALSGFQVSHFLWLYFFFSLVMNFAGDKSIYFDSAKKRNFNFTQFQFRRF